MNLSIPTISQRKKQAIAVLGLTVAAGFAVRWYLNRSRAFVIPGSRSTIPDEVGHYDMDGVSFDDKEGVVVGSDKSASSKPRSGIVHKVTKALKRDELPSATY